MRSSTLPIDRLAAARDLWPLGTLDAWQGRAPALPDRVSWPASTGEVSALLADAAAEGVAVVPYGAGSGVCGGASGRAGAWVLDTKDLATIGPLDADARTVRVGAGVIGQQLEDWLQARGYTLGHSPSSISCSTVGGWAAARSAGQFSSRYGVFEDMVVALEAVAPSIGRFTLGAGGDRPDAWMDLVLGSEGTLAVITELTLRVWPAPEARLLRGYRFGDVATALRAMRRLMQGELHPSVVRLYDPVDTRIGGRTRPGGARAPTSGAVRWLTSALARVEALPGVKARSLALPLALPRLLNRVAAGVASGCLLVVGWEGDDAVVRALSEEGHRLLCDEGTDLGSGPGERWYASRHAVSYKLMPVFERGGFADTMEVAAPWSRLETLYDGVRAALGRTAVVMAHMSHVYPEGGSIYFSFAGAGTRDRYEATWKAALDAVLEGGGTLSHHHGVGQLKARHAAAEVGPAVAGWRALKGELDPDGLLNPGRLFVDEGVEDPAVQPSPHPADDHLARTPVHATLQERTRVAEPLWPWTRLPGLPGGSVHRGRAAGSRWRRRWVAGPVGSGGVRGRRWGRICAVGWPASREPRHLGRRGRGVAVDGCAEVAAPWAVAAGLLRSDLRPGVLAVDDGTLYVGFRGPAAAALGVLASARVPGGLRSTEWRTFPLPDGPLEPCAEDDPQAIHATPQGVYRRRL